MSWIWDELHVFFDGTEWLPEFPFSFFDRSTTVEAFVWLTEHTEEVEWPKLWIPNKHIRVPYQTLREAAEFAVSGRAQIFEIVLHGLHYNGITMPDLECKVDPYGITLNCPSEDGWNARTLEALFEVLYHLADMDPDCYFMMGDLPGDAQEYYFEFMWSRFVLEYTA